MTGELIVVQHGCPQCNFRKEGKPLTIQIPGLEPFQFTCPHCGKTGWIQYQAMGTPIVHLLDWRYRWRDGTISRYLVRDCFLCKGNYSVYLQREAAMAEFFGWCKSCGKGSGNGA